MRKRITVTLMVAVSLIATSCGSGGTPPTKAEFVKRANAICKAGIKRKYDDFQAYVAHEGGGTASVKARQEKAAMTVFIPDIQAEAGELAALTAPDGEERKVAAMVTALTVGIGRAEKDPAGYVLGDSKPFAEFDSLAAEYGLTECSGL